MEIKGSIRRINQVEKISETFTKRTFVITDNSKPAYPQHLAIELHNAKTALIDGFLIGDNVRVSCDLKGREWIAPDGTTKYFMSIVGWVVERSV